MTTSSPADWNPALRLVTIEEAAVSVDRPESTIRRWICEQRVTVFAKYGRRTLILESELLKAEAEARKR
jgi:hypothetical protein